jgi:hypothetical protein
MELVSRTKPLILPSAYSITFHLQPIEGEMSKLKTIIHAYHDQFMYELERFIQLTQSGGKYKGRLLNLYLSTHTLNFKIMINANELRIGNWISRTAGEMTVVGISEIALEFNDGDTVDLKYIEGIPLTPELLEACGFVKSSRNYSSPVYEINLGEGINGNDELRIDMNGSADLVGCTPDEAVYIKYDVKYIHQVQNLYCIITGNELTVNFPETVK